MQRDDMRTVSIFKNGKNQAIRLPNDMAYEGVGELEITRNGDVVTLRPARPTWGSMAELPKADSDFLQERPDVVNDEGRFNP
jgi:antitoxin VapB